MAIHMNGASMGAVSPPRCTVTHAAPKPGEMPAVIVDISAAQALGYAPAHNLKSGLSTVWPEFSEAAK
jgi:hypothetical protein